MIYKNLIYIFNKIIKYIIYNKRKNIMSLSDSLKPNYQ